MSNKTSESNSKQIKNVRKETNSIEQQQQPQQIAENTTTTTPTISNTTNEVTNSSSRINENQNIDEAIIDKNIDTANRYQQLETINTIQSIFNNYNQLQKNILNNTYQSAFSKFIINDSLYNSKSHFAVLDQLKIYSKINQNIIDSAINITRTIHELLVEYIEIFNKIIELGQEYYTNAIKNYFNLVKKIEST